MKRKKARAGSHLRFAQRAARYRGDDCLFWPFPLMKNGYGKMRFRGAQSGAHRVVCIIAHGEPPTPKHQACHSCRGALDGCVSPRHISWQTCKQNIHDKYRDGTMPDQKGSKNNYAKLTEAEVHVIRQQARSRGNGRKLAAKFNVSPATISNIKNGKMWGHV